MTIGDLRRAIIELKKHDERAQLTLDEVGIVLDHPNGNSARIGWPEIETEANPVEDAWAWCEAQPEVALDR